jgi:hypothetical protein
MNRARFGIVFAFLLTHQYGDPCAGQDKEKKSDCERWFPDSIGVTAGDGKVFKA